MNEIEKTNTRIRSFELVLCWLNDFTPQYAESLYISPINIVTPNVSSKQYLFLPTGTFHPWPRHWSKLHCRYQALERRHCYGTKGSWATLCTCNVGLQGE